MADKLSSQRAKIEELVSQRRFQDAVKVARLTLLSTPQDIESRLLLGKSLMCLARYDDVLAEAQIVLEINDSKSEAWTLKGEALFFKGSFGKALNALNRAENLDANNKKVKKLIDEIQLTQDPDLDTGSVGVDTAATKTYPMEETGELEGDPTEIMDLDNMEEGADGSDENDQPHPDNNEALKTTPAEKEIVDKEESEASEEKPSQSEQVADERLLVSEKEEISEELLAVGDSTTMDELPAGLMADDTETEKEVEPAQHEENKEKKEEEAKAEKKVAGETSNNEGVSKAVDEEYEQNRAESSKDGTKELDIGDLEFIEESKVKHVSKEQVSESTVEPENKGHRLKSPKVERKKGKGTSPSREKPVFGERKEAQRKIESAKTEPLEEIKDSEEEEETDARGAVVKFISPERLVTVEQVAVTTGEIAGLHQRSIKPIEEHRKISSVELELDKTRSLKPKRAKEESRKPKRSNLFSGASPHQVSDEDDLDDIKNLFEEKPGNRLPKSKLPSPVKKQRSGSAHPPALVDIDEDMDEVLTTPHLKSKNLPPMSPAPPKRPKLNNDPFAEQRKARNAHPPVPRPLDRKKPSSKNQGRLQQRKPSIRSPGAPMPPSPPKSQPAAPPAPQDHPRPRTPAGTPAPVRPAERIAPQHPAHTPAPPRSAGFSHASMGQSRTNGLRSRANISTSKRTPVGPRTPRPPLSDTHSRSLSGTNTIFAAKKALKSPLWLGVGLVAIVLIVAVTSGLFYVRSQSAKREQEKKEKAFALMTRGDMEGLRGATLIFDKLENDKKAQAAQSLALLLLSLEFGHSVEPAKKALQNIKGEQSALGTAAKIGVLILSGKNKAALDLADDAIGKWSKSAWIFYVRGVALVTYGNWEAAANHFRHALRLKDAPSIWIYFALARLWIIAEDPEKAKPAIASLKKKASGNPSVELLDIRLRLLECKQRQGCPCSELKADLKRVRHNRIKTWTTFHQSWANLVETKLHLCLRNQEAAETSLRAMQEKPDINQVDFQEVASEALLALQRQPKAKEKLEALKKRYPSRSRVLLLLAQSYLESDLAQKALGELASVENRFRGARWYSIHAQVLLELKRNRDALVTIEGGLKIAPDNLSLQIMKVRALQASNRLSSSQELAEKLFKEHPQNVDILLAGSEVLEKQNKLVMAEARLKAALEHDGGNPKVHSALGRVSAKRGKWESAQLHLRRAASIQPSSLSNWLELGDLAFQQGRYEAAASPYRQVLKRSPNHSRALVRLARIHVMTGNFQEAFKTLRKISEKDRDSTWNLVNGWGHLREGDYTKADQYLEAAVKSSKADFIQANGLLGLSAIYQLQYRKAEQLLFRVNKQKRRHPFIRLIRGRLWLAKRKVRVALRHFNNARKSCNSYPCSPRLAAIIRAYRGRAFFLSGKGRLGYKDFNKALEIDPYCAMAYHLQGACLYEEERESEAFQSLLKGHSLDRGYAETHYYLGEIYRNKGQRKKAAEHFRTYLKYRRYGDLVSAARRGLSVVD